jgi:peptide deformylase
MVRGGAAAFRAADPRSASTVSGGLATMNFGEPARRPGSARALDHPPASMIRKIVKYGDPILETACGPVTDFETPEIRKLVEDMFETMYQASGVGLAAPQIGVSKRLTVIDCSGGEKPEEKLVLINPEIIDREGQQVGEEGCLSIPGFREDVKRARKVTARAQDLQGNFFEVTGEDLLARAIQHENDHLNGILFLQHLSPLKRELIKRKIRKLKRKGDWD